jgi:hypothetical protein
MTHIQTARRSHARGHTLVQLVVATALGLLVTAAVVSLYALQRRIVTHLDATRRLYDAGQQALEALTVHARLAGFTDAERFGAAMTPRPVAPRGYLAVTMHAWLTRTTRAASRRATIRMEWCFATRRTLYQRRCRPSAIR